MFTIKSRAKIAGSIEFVGTIDAERSFSRLYENIKSQPYEYDYVKLCCLGFEILNLN